MSGWLADFDAERTPASDVIEMTIAEARDARAVRDGAAPKSKARLRLEVLERLAAKRELCRRADAGDRQAVTELVRERAEAELLTEKAKAHAEEQYRIICGLPRA